MRKRKNLSKYVTISEEPVMERPTIKAEVVEDEKKLLVRILMKWI